MKKSLLLFILIQIFLANKSDSQTVSLKKTWISAKLEYLKFSDTIALFEYAHNTREYHYKIKGKIIILTEYYFTSKDKLRHENEFAFEITKLTADTLIIKPFSQSSKRLISGKEFLLFVDSLKVNDTKFLFEKLFFSGSRCMGTCPKMKIEINAAGKVFFLGEYNTEIYKGLYKGQLKPGDLKKLNSILKNSWLDNFPEDLGSALDVPSYHFIFYYNGRKKVSGGYSVPYFNRELLSFLLNIYKKADLIKYSFTYNFEK